MNNPAMYTARRGSTVDRTKALPVPSRNTAGDAVKSKTVTR
jgi:hypothetical protein